MEKLICTQCNKKTFKLIEHLCPACFEASEGPVKDMKFEDTPEQIEFRSKSVAYMDKKTGRMHFEIPSGEAWKFDPWASYDILFKKVIPSRSISK